MPKEKVTTTQELEEKYCSHTYLFDERFLSRMETKATCRKCGCELIIHPVVRVAIENEQN